MTWPRPTRMGRLAFLGALVLAACECTSKPALHDGGVRGDAPPAVAETLTLGAEGGIVAIVDPSSSLFGANLVIGPDILARLTEVSLAEAESMPEHGNALGVGSILEVGNEELDLARPGVAEIPVPDGVDPDDLTVARWDATLEEWIVLAGVEQLWEDPMEQRGGLLRFQVDGAGSFRAVYREPQIVSVLNDGSGPLEVGIGAARYTRFTPVPQPPDEIGAAIAPHEDEPLLLLPGEYVLQATFEGETVPRCERLTLVDPVTTVPVSVSFSDFTPPCPLPAVRVTATPTTVAPGATVELHATATSTAGSMVTWYWQSTGGSVFGDLSGEAMSGEMITTMWTAPDATGDYYVGLVAVAEDDWFASAMARITVETRNQRPMITQLTATPILVGPGFPDGARSIAEPSSPGVTRFRAVVSDLDGDPVSVYWTHRQPGDWFDIDSGARLGIDPDTGLVIWPATGMPYVEDQILYMAPPAGYVDSLSRGWWMPAAVSASDGDLRDRAFRIVAVVRQAQSLDAGPEPDGGFRDAGRRDAGTRDAGRDAGPTTPPVVGRCLSVVDSECEMYVGAAYSADLAALEASCTDMGRTWTEGFACPESGSIGACYRFSGEAREVATVYYGGSPTSAELMMLTNDCRMLPVAEGGPGTWQRPYRAPR